MGYYYNIGDQVIDLPSALGGDRKRYTIIEVTSEKADGTKWEPGDLTRDDCLDCEVPPDFEAVTLDGVPSDPTGDGTFSDPGRNWFEVIKPDEDIEQALKDFIY